MSDARSPVDEAASRLAAKHPAAALNEYGRCVGAGFQVTPGTGGRARVHHQLPPVDLLDPDRPSGGQRWEEQQRAVAEYACTLEDAGWTVERRTVLADQFLLATPKAAR